MSANDDEIGLILGRNSQDLPIGLPAQYPHLRPACLSDILWNERMKARGELGLHLEDFAQCRRIRARKDALANPG